MGAQVIAALEHYRDVVLQLDYDEQLACFTDDAEFSQGNDAPVMGRAQIRSLLLLQAGSKVVGYELRAAATRVQGTIAIQNGFYSQRIISPKHESTLVKGVFEVQWARQADGSWLISRLHSDAVDDGNKQQ